MGIVVAVGVDLTQLLLADAVQARAIGKFRGVVLWLGLNSSCVDEKEKGSEHGTTGSKQHC